MYARLLTPALLALLAPALTLPLRAQDKVLMRQHWEPGKVYHVESHTDIEMNVPGVPGGGGQNTSVIQQMDITVSKEEGSDRKLAQVNFAAIKAMVNAAGQLLTYDSTDPAMSQPMLQQAFGALLGKSVTLVFDKDDKCVDVKVPDDFIPTPVGAGRGPNGKQFGELMRDTLAFGLPIEALAVGGTFAIEKNINVAPIGAINTKVKGRYDSVVQHEGRRHARIVSEGTMEIPTDASASTPPGFSFDPNSKLSSETLYDLERKVISVSTGRNELKMNAAGQQITMKQNVVTTLKGIEDAPAARK